MIFPQIRDRATKNKLMRQWGNACDALEDALQTFEEAVPRRDDYSNAENFQKAIEQHNSYRAAVRSIIDGYLGGLIAHFTPPLRPFWSGRTTGGGTKK